MISKRMQAALNEQISAELSSAYTYLSMSAWCEARNLPGFAAWFRRQAREETDHALRIFDYVNDRNAAVDLKAIPAPRARYRDIEAVWTETLAHEQEISKRINRLYAQAQTEKDFATQAMLQWFLTEQVEEEKTAGLILDQVKSIGSSSSALFFLDRHVGKDSEDKEG